MPERGYQSNEKSIQYWQAVLPTVEQTRELPKVEEVGPSPLRKPAMNSSASQLPPDLKKLHTHPGD